MGDSNEGFDTLVTRPWIESYTMPLSICFISLVFVFLFKIIKFIKKRNKKRSFQFIFYTLLLLWASLRSVFWGTFTFQTSDNTLTSTSIYVIIYQIPIAVQFGIYSLLVLYYVEGIHRFQNRSFKQKNKFYFGAYLISNLISLCFIIYYTAFVITGNLNPLQVNKEDALFNTIVFYTLAFLLGFYGWKLHIAMTLVSDRNIPFLSHVKLLWGTVILITIFLSRATYDFIQIFTDTEIVGLIPAGLVSNLLRFFLVFIWEILPNVILLLIFWSTPGSHVGKVSKPLLDKMTSEKISFSPRLLEDEVNDPYVVYGSPIFSSTSIEYNSDHI